MRNPYNYPDDFDEYLRSIAPGKSSAELTEMINQHYGKRVISHKRLRNYLGNHGIKTGYYAGRFQKGQESFTKGKKQEDYMSPEALERAKATRFKPGHEPGNTKPVGTITQRADGYLYIKRADEGRYWDQWQPLQRYVWERHNGPIPDGMLITFKDGDPTNCDIDNLMLIDTATNAQLNMRGLRSTNPEATEAAASLVKLDRMIIQKRGGKKNAERESD